MVRAGINEQEAFMVKKKPVKKKVARRKTSRRPEIVKGGKAKTVRRKRTGSSMSGVVLRILNPHPRKGHPRVLYANSIGEPIRTQICLCYGCTKFDSDRREKNCEIANDAFYLAVKHDIAAPITRCPKFKPVDGVDVV